MCYVMVEESASIKQPHTDCKYHLIIAAVLLKVGYEIISLTV